MKKISYLDIVKTLLSEKEFSAFTQRYNKPLQKSIKILKSKTEFSAFQEQIAKD
jgi:hypothetical protein